MKWTGATTIYDKLKKNQNIMTFLAILESINTDGLNRDNYRIKHFVDILLPVPTGPKSISDATTFIPYTGPWLINF